MKNSDRGNRESIIEEIRKNCAKPSGEKLSYEDAREIADTLYTLADIIIDMYLENRRNDPPDKDHESKS